MIKLLPLATIYLERGVISYSLQEPPATCALWAEGLAWLSQTPSCRALFADERRVVRGYNPFPPCFVPHLIHPFPTQLGWFASILGCNKAGRITGSSDFAPLRTYSQAR